MKKTPLILFLTLLFLIILVYYAYKPGQIQEDFLEVSFSTITINSEIADTPEKRAKGLMEREFLGEYEGMLFVFQDEKERKFWMKNTLIPLDIIFLDKNKKIVNIAEKAQPCYETTCPAYSSQKPAKYVIEVNSGFCKEHEIKESDSVVFQLSL